MQLSYASNIFQLQCVSRWASSPSLCNRLSPSWRSFNPVSRCACRIWMSCLVDDPYIHWLILQDVQLMHLQTNTEAWEARKKKEYLDCRHEVTKALDVTAFGCQKSSKLKSCKSLMVRCSVHDFPQPATLIWMGESNAFGEVWRYLRPSLCSELTAWKHPKIWEIRQPSQMEAWDDHECGLLDWYFQAWALMNWCSPTGRRHPLSCGPRRLRTYCRGWRHRGVSPNRS